MHLRPLLLTLAAAGLLPLSATATPATSVTVVGRLPAEAEAVAGAYAMADGSQLRLVRRGQALIAEWDGRTGVSLRPLGPRIFASADGHLRLQFESHVNGSVSRIALTRTVAVPAGE